MGGLGGRKRVTAYQLLDKLDHYCIINLLAFSSHFYPLLIWLIVNSA